MTLSTALTSTSVSYLLARRATSRACSRFLCLLFLFPSSFLQAKLVLKSLLVVAKQAKTSELKSYALRGCCRSSSHSSINGLGGSLLAVSGQLSSIPRPPRDPSLVVSLFLDSLLSFTPPLTLPSGPSAPLAPPPPPSSLLETRRLCLLALGSGSCQSLCHGALSHLPSHIKRLEIVLFHFLLHVPPAPPTACHTFRALSFRTLSQFFFFFLFLSSAGS